MNKTLEQGQTELEEELELREMAQYKASWAEARKAEFATEREWVEAEKKRYFFSRTRICILYKIFFLAPLYFTGWRRTSNKLSSINHGKLY